jgi:hypothetical protein
MYIIVQIIDCQLIGILFTLSPNITRRRLKGILIQFSPLLVELELDESIFQNFEASAT